MAVSTRGEAFRRKHERLLTAARIEFAEHGFCGAEIHRICIRSQLGIGTFYSHFNGKAELLKAVMELELSPFLVALRKRDIDRDRFAQLLAETELPTHCRLRHVWRDAAFYDNTISLDRERLTAIQLSRIATIVARSRRAAGITDAVLSPREAAWMVLGVMRESSTSTRGPSRRLAKLVIRVLDTAIVAPRSRLPS